LEKLSDVLMELGDYKKAKEGYYKVLEILEKNFG
jgi:hypothetical protein